MPILPPTTPTVPPAQPGSYCPQDALNLVQQFAHGLPVQKVAAPVCDMINSMIWTFYPWSWSIESFTPIICVDGQQDYAVTDQNILRPLKFRIVRTDVTPNEYRELAALANLSPELTRRGGIETIRAFTYFASGPIVRLQYATSVGTTQQLQLQGEYQFQPTRITSATLDTPFQFPDRYFNVFVEGLKWKIYQLGDDPRAGTAQYSKNGSMMRQYTNQLGLFQESLLQMARTEDLQSGDEFMFPDDPLGGGRGAWPGIYGL